MVQDLRGLISTIRMMALTISLSPIVRITLDRDLCPTNLCIQPKVAIALVKHKRREVWDSSRRLTFKGRLNSNALILDGFQHIARGAQRCPAHRADVSPSTRSHP
jgi:hypothetical protein